MVSVNANLDLKTYEVFQEGRMNEDLADLCAEELGITFFARDFELPTRTPIKILPISNCSKQSFLNLPESPTSRPEFADLFS